MLRKFRIGHKKNEGPHDQPNGQTNGQTNGQSNGQGSGQINGLSSSQSNGAGRSELGRKRSSFRPQKKKKEEEEHVDHSASRKDVESSFDQFAQLIHASRRPLPTQTDGAILDHTEPTGLVQDLKALGFKDVGTLMNVMKGKVTGELLDDKTYLMEHLMQAGRALGRNPFVANSMQLVSGLPPLSKTRVDLTNTFVDELWNSLEHPPLSYLGDQFAFRTGDGSYNVSSHRAGDDPTLILVEHHVSALGSCKYTLCSLCASEYHSARCIARSGSCVR